MRRLLYSLGFVLGLASAAHAQALKAEVFVTGLSLPVGFVQDPTLPDTQYVLEQDGRIRVVRNGALQGTDFLDLSGQTSATGEQGLLGMAFAPDYATSGRVFVNFTDLNGNTVIARFARSSGDPRRADDSTRFDLIWPDGQSYIAQPFANHNGGNLQFGPDGMLYIGLGDGGSGNDPGHRAQNPSTLLGKFLRVNVNVSDSDPEGYDVPPDNPFVNTPGYLKEIWSIGWRNPWRYSFDTFGTGATGALIVGDVGQGQREEIDYEPANTGGRNYGWRLREGSIATPGVPASPGPAFLPLTEPIYDYGRSVGATIVGGYVYRGTALPASYRGRYFWADFVSGRVWSMALNIGAGGEATAGDILEHTAELGGASMIGNISSLGMDANGELYVVSYGSGTIRKIRGVTQLAMALDIPNGAIRTQPFTAAGWAIDLNLTDANGVDTVHVWGFPANGAAPVFLGASYGVSRPDVTSAFGSQYQNPGYSVSVSGLAGGTYTITAFAHSTVTGQFDRAVSSHVTVASGPSITIDTPADGSAAAARFTLSGWAADFDAASSTGVDTVHVWATPAGGAARFVGIATYGTTRNDIAETYGSRFASSGWTLDVNGLSAGTWTLRAFAHSTATNAFRASSAVTVQVQSGLLMAVDSPQPGGVSGAFQVTGWALDLAHPSTSGISAVHVWAFPTDGTPPSFLGEATRNVIRPDVGNAFGAQFSSSGFTLNVTTLPAGTYDIVIFAQSSLTGRFDLVRVVRIVKS